MKGLQKMIWNFRTMKWFKNLKSRISKWSLRTKKLNKKYLDLTSSSITLNNSLSNIRTWKMGLETKVTSLNFKIRLIKLKTMRWIFMEIKGFSCLSLRNQRSLNFNNNYLKIGGFHSSLKLQRPLLKDKTMSATFKQTFRVNSTSRAWPKVLGQWKMWLKEDSFPIDRTLQLLWPKASTSAKMDR